MSGKSVLFFASALLYFRGTASDNVTGYDNTTLAVHHNHTFNETVGTLCESGRYQSPIDIKPELLLYDPSLQRIITNGKKVNGVLSNRGYDIVLDVEDGVNITAGPLEYTYTICKIRFSAGNSRRQGSGHHVDGIRFPLEIQLYTFNRDLYTNFQEAKNKPFGVTGIVIFGKESSVSNEAFSLLARQMKHVVPQGTKVKVTGLPLKILLPKTDFYVTYEGSLPYPDCFESVIWIVLNKPIDVTRQQLYAVRKMTYTSSSAMERVLRKINQPPQPLYNRVLRTNINVKPKSELCDMKRITNYKGPATWITRDQYLKRR